MENKKEVWKDVKGFEGMYQVSNLGNIFNCVNKCILKKWGWGKNNKYHGVCLRNLNKKQDKKQVHRLVAIAFIPNPENKPQVNHINGIKRDNRVENLEWNTCKENIAHSWENNLARVPRGEKCKSSKFKEADIIEIRRLYSSGEKTRYRIAKIYKTCHSNISKIIEKRTWAHVK